MSDKFKILNSYLAQGKTIEFNELINNLKKNKDINEEIYYKYLGFFHIKKNNYDIAEKNLIKSTKLNDKNFDNYLNLGVCYSKLNKLDLSIKSFEKSLNLKNNFADTYILYSRVLREKNLEEKSINVLKTGLKKVTEGQSKIYLELAEIYRLQRDYLLAIPNYHQVLKKNQNNYIIFNSLAVCYEAIGEIYLAEKNYSKAIKIKPDYFEAISNLGNLKRANGENIAALSMFEKCLKINQPKSKVFRYISIFHKFISKEDKYLNLMNNYLDNNQLKNNDPDIHELYFALSKAYEDLKDVKSFGQFLTLANKEKRKQISDLTVRKELEFYDVIKSTFSSDFIDSFRPKLDGKKIILVLGMPRSGTTLVEQILGSHSKIIPGGEQVFFQNILKNKFNFFNYKNFENEVRSNFLNYAESIGLEYIDKLKNINTSKIVTDKLPFNFFYIGFYLGIYNNIKIVHVHREAMDNCFSIFKNFFPEQVNFAYDQNELAEYYCKYLDLMKFWSKKFENQIFNIKYEDLIAEPKKTTQALLSYCNLNWEDKCLKYYESKKTVNTLSSTQVRSPIYKSSINSWIKYKDYLEDLEKILSEKKFYL